MCTHYRHNDKVIKMKKILSQIIFLIFFCSNVNGNEPTKENDFSLIAPNSLLYFAAILPPDEIFGYHRLMLINQYADQLIKYDLISEEYSLDEDGTFKLYSSYKSRNFTRISKDLNIKLLKINDEKKRIKIFNENKNRLYDLINEYQKDTGKLITKNDLLNHWKLKSNQDGLIKKTLFTIVAKHKSSSEFFKINGKYYTKNTATNMARLKCTLGFEGKKDPSGCYIYSINGKIQNEEDKKIAKDLDKNEDNDAKQNEIDKLKDELKKLKAEKQNTFELEKIYGKECEGSFFSLFNKGFKKGTKEYENCLKDRESQKIAEIKKQSEEKKALEEKLKKMSQIERIQYQCEKVFNFYKHSKKFKDCTLEVYMAESEAKKIELEKEVLLANLETSKLRLKTAQLELEISKANEEAKRVAKLEEQKTRELEEQRKVLAKKETNNAKGLGSFLDLISVGLQIYSLTSPTPSIGSGSSVSSAMQCFTSGMFQYCN